MKNVFFVILFFCGMNFQAQELNLFLIGDSTMSDKKDPDKNPEYGWGQVLPELLTDEIKVDNHAVNGRSTRSFLGEGRWETVLEKLQPGDYIFIQFGHNDQKYKSPDRFTNPFTGYRNNLERFVIEARAKGANPVLFSSIVRRNFNEHGTLIDTHGEYPLVVRLVADDLEVPFVDLQRATEELELYYGEEDSKKLHLHFEAGENDYFPDGKADDTHLSKEGAKLVASMALQKMAEFDPAFKSYIKKDVLRKKIPGNKN